MTPTHIVLAMCAVGLIGIVASIVQEERVDVHHARRWATPLKITFGLQLVGSGLLGVAYWKEHRPEAQVPASWKRVDAVRALDDGGAIVEWRDPRSSWLARYDGKRARWSHAVPPPDSSTLAVGPNYVFFASAERPTKIALFDLETGTERWSTILQDTGVLRVVAGTPSLFLDVGAKWIEVSTSSGKILGAIEDASADVDVTNATVRRIEAPRDTHWRSEGRCSLDGKLFEFGFDPEAEFGAGRMRVTDEAGMRTIPVDFIADTCGYYRDSLVAFVTRGYAGRLRMLRLNSAGDVIRDAVVVEARRDAWLLVGEPAQQPLSGRLPRFVPLIAMTHGDVDAYEYRSLVVDLETGAVKVNAPTAVGTDPIALQRTERDPPWTLHRTSWIRSVRNELEVFDGVTGQLAGTFTISFKPFQRNEVDLQQAAAGKLWLYDPTVDEIALVRLDLASMTADVLIGPVQVSVHK